MACVGDDDFGRINLDRLRADGADVSAVSVSAEFPTGSAFVRYREDGSRDFVFNIGKSAAALVGLTDAAKALFARAGHLHVMGTAFAIPGVWEMFEYAIGVIKARGGSVSLDPNLRKELLGHGQTRERFAKLVDVADLILPSGDELFMAAGVEGSEDAAVDCAAFAVEEIDPTGAGDCFGGAYVACRRLGMPVEQALTYANAAGARNVGVRGPMEGAGSRAELDSFIAQTPRRAA